MDNFREIIKKIGEELDIKVTLLSDNWVFALEKNNEIHYIQGYKFDLNDHAIGNIMDDKGLFNDLMKYKDLPTIEQIGFYQVYDKDIVLDYFNKHKKIIVKGNIGTCGENVYLVTNEEDLFNKIDYLLKKQNSISIEPYYDIKNEYRVILLNKEVKIIYGKERPVIIGDGKKTVKELAIEFNEFFLHNKVKNSLYIPKLGERVELDYRYNLSQGARLFIDIDNELKNKLIDIAKKVTSTLNINFASVDIIHTTDNKLLVLEANSGVMMDNYIRLCPNGYQNAYNVYLEAIKLMFNMK